MAPPGALRENVPGPPSGFQWPWVLLGLQVLQCSLLVSLGLHLTLPLRLSPNPPLYRDTSHIGVVPTLMTSSQLDYLCNDPNSK